MAESSTRNQTAVDPALPEKKRGRRRLIGAAAFLAGAAVIFSLVFDHEPKPATPELVLKVPPRDKSATVDGPPVVPAVVPPAAPPVSPAVVPSEPPKYTAPGTESSKTESSKTEAPKSEAPKPEAPKLETPKIEEPKVDAAKTVAPKSEPVKTKDTDPLGTLSREANGAKVASTSSASFMVQIGAFSSAEKLEGAIEKAKSAGFKVVTEKVKTTNGERTRVRVGPFKSRESANSAREKLKAQGLEPALIAL